MLKAIWAFVSFAALFYFAIDLMQTTSKKQKLSAMKQLLIALGCSLLAVLVLSIIVVVF
jgi:hypothetical protein